MKKFIMLAAVLGLFIIGHAALAALQEPGSLAPSATIFATPSTVVAGKSTTLTWTSKNVYSCIASGAWSGSKARAGTKVVTPSQTSTYGLTCSGRNGETYVSVVVAVTATPPQPPATTTPPVATTTPPITPTSTPTTTPPQPPQPTTTPPQPPQPPQPTTTPPTVTCPAFTVPSCGANMYPTPGRVDSNGCIQASVCTAAVVPGTPQLLSAPAGSSYIFGGEYAGSAFAGSNAAVVYAPATGSASISYSGLGLDTRKVWWLSGKVGLSPLVVVAPTTTPPVATTTPPTATTTPPTGGGGGKRGGSGSIQGAAYGGAARVTITATADAIDPSDPTSEVLYTGTLSPTSGLQSLKIPLGVWGMRPNLKLVVSVQKTGTDSLTYGAVVDGLGVYTFGDRPDQGIVNNDPEWKSADQQQKQLTSLAQFNVTWIHDSIRTTGASWPQAPLLKREQDQGKKIQLVVGQIDEDYDAGIGARVPGTNEWGGALPLSKINLNLYEQRLKNNLTSYKNAGVDVKAVEVGNELDLLGFNADIPQNRAPTAADYQLFAESYAKFLERTVSVVKRPEFYPNAKIILGSPAIDWSPALGKLEPGRMYAPLKNLNGKNYFALVDGVGIHYYPADHEDGSQSLARTTAFLAAIGEPQRPLWVSEWGFYNNRFPNAAGKDRYRAFVDLYDKILRSENKVVFMTNFALDEFNFPFNLVDSSYNKLPEARFFDHYPSPVPSSVVLEPSMQNTQTACTSCAIKDWVSELIADIRDFVLTKLGN